MSEWQPITTAPKDGTIVVVLVNERIYPDGRPTLAFWSNEKRWWQELRANCVIVTHWMPLPSPPPCPIVTAAYLQERYQLDDVHAKLLQDDLLPWFGFYGTHPLPRAGTEQELHPVSTPPSASAAP